MVEEERVPFASEHFAQSVKRGVQLLLPTDHVTAEDIESDRAPIISEGGIPSIRIV